MPGCLADLAGLDRGKQNGRGCVGLRLKGQFEQRQHRRSAQQRPARAASFTSRGTRLDRDE